MSSAPVRPDGVQIWSDFEAASTPGVLLHVIDDVVEVASDKALIEDETLGVVIPGTSTAIEFATRRRVIRLEFEDGMVEEWRIVRLEDTDSTEAWRKIIQCEGAIMALNGPCLVENVDDNGITRTRFELLEFTAEEYLSSFIIPASPTWWELGLVETTERFDLLFDNYTPLRAIAEILRITGFEREVERLEGGIHRLKIVEFSGVFRLAFEDLLDIFTDPARINLNVHAPLTVAIGAWEYNLAAGSFKTNPGASFGVDRETPFGDDWARSTEDLTDDSFRLTSRIGRLGVDNTGLEMGLYIWAETTVAAASIVGEGLIVFWKRISGSEMSLLFERRNAAGAIVQSGTLETPVSYPVDTDSFLRLVVNETPIGENPVVEVFRVNGTALDPIPLLSNLAKVGEIAVGVDFRDGDHKAHGIFMTATQGRIRNWLLESLPRTEPTPEFELGKNTTGVGRSEDDRDTATKIYGVGGTDQLGRITLAAARFAVVELP